MSGKYTADGFVEDNTTLFREESVAEIELDIATATKDQLREQVRTLRDEVRALRNRLFDNEREHRQSEEFSEMMHVEADEKYGDACRAVIAALVVLHKEWKL